MRNMLISVFALLCLCECIGAELQNVVGYQNLTLPPGKSMVVIPVREVGSGKKLTLGTLLPFANNGDYVNLPMGKARVGLSENGRHWFVGNEIADGYEIDPGSKLPYWNSGDKPITLSVSGEVAIEFPPTEVNQQDEKPTLPRQRTVEIKPQRPPMLMADILSYSTVQIVSPLGDGKVRTGTGFFYYCQKGKYGVPVIITNRHVVDGVRNSCFEFTVMKDGRPTDKTIPYVTDYSQVKWVALPDPTVDLAALPILPFINTAKEKHGVEIFIAPFNASHIPDEKYFSGICQLDDVIMIGYPDSLRDTIHNQPIFRKGSIATNPNKPINGYDEFLIDMAVYGGSSGSPILLADEGPHLNRSIRLMETHGRVKLVGVNKATCIHSETGTVNVVVHPTAEVDLVPQMKIPNNLGVIIHAKRIRELEEYILKMVGADKE